MYGGEVNSVNTGGKFAYPRPTALCIAAPPSRTVWAILRIFTGSSNLSTPRLTWGFPDPHRYPQGIIPILKLLGTASYTRASTQGPSYLPLLLWRAPILTGDLYPQLWTEPVENVEAGQQRAYSACGA